MLVTSHGMANSNFCTSQRTKRPNYLLILKLPLTHQLVHMLVCIPGTQSKFKSYAQVWSMCLSIT